MIPFYEPLVEMMTQGDERLVRQVLHPHHAGQRVELGDRRRLLCVKGVITRREDGRDPSALGRAVRHAVVIALGRRFCL